MAYMYCIKLGIPGLELGDEILELLGFGLTYLQVGGLAVDCSSLPEPPGAARA